MVLDPQGEALKRVPLVHHAAEALKGHPILAENGWLWTLGEWLRNSASFPMVVLLCAFAFVSTRLFVRALFALYDEVTERCRRRPWFLRSGRVLLAPFHKRSFWESEYRGETEPFEWYVDCESLDSLLGQLVLPGQRVLYVGCGTSGICRRLRDCHGVSDVTGVDSCSAALECSRDLERSKETASNDMGCTPRVQLARMDARCLAFRDASFDVLVDKGMIDSVSCCSVRGDADAVAVLRECCRVLRPGGKLLLVTALEFEVCRQFLNDGVAGMEWSTHCELPDAHPEWEGRRHYEAYVFTKPEL